MPNDESLELSDRQKTKTILPDAEDWKRQFVKLLEDEYVLAAAQLPDSASLVDFRRVMLTAFVDVLEESGANAEEILQLLKNDVHRLTPVNKSDKWTPEKNARRLKLIDKFIQQTISLEETVEWEQLTDQMRIHSDTEAMVPLEGARMLHRRLTRTDDSEHTPN